MRLRQIGIVAAGLAPVLLAACEEAFDPIQANDLTFSIYGHLEATADTQWVRVTPIRTSVETVPEPIDAVVTVQEIETGTTVVMSDSLFRYLPVNLGDVDIHAHNFSTTLPMVPGRRYRLTATRSDGANASATVLIPVIADPVLEVTIRYHSIQSSLLRPARGAIRGMRHIGMILGLENVPGTCDYPFSVHQQYLRVIQHAQRDGDPHVALLEWREDGDPLEIRPPYVPKPPACVLEPKRIAVVASGAEWPYPELSHLRELSHPGSVNNIEGGLGFLAGVQTHEFPFATCVPIISTSGFGEMRFDVNDRLTVIPGLVLTIEPRAAFEPRFRMNWYPGWVEGGELTAAAGVYYQDLAGISDVRDVSSVFVAWMPVPGDEVMRSLHAQMGWQQRHGDGLQWSVEGEAGIVSR